LIKLKKLFDEGNFLKNANAIAKKNPKNLKNYFKIFLYLNFNIKKCKIIPIEMASGSYFLKSNLFKTKKINTSLRFLKFSKY
jgi:hypothetical protein